MLNVEADPLVRVRLDISYDGTDFSGWAVQPERRTVQAVVQKALATVLRQPGVALTVAGRTDAGVHASGQVAHLDVPASLWAPVEGRLVRRLAGVLPPDVRVLSARRAAPEFDARFSALWRRYVYRLSDAEGGPPPLLRRQVAAAKRGLDVVAMATAAAQLLGLHDFVAFCRSRESSTTIRTLQSLTVERSDELIVCTVQADAFCHSMVRSLVGALLAVGEGRRDSAWPAELFSRVARADEITVAPARGLTLVEVGYPPSSELGTRAGLTRAKRLVL